MCAAMAVVMALMVAGAGPSALTPSVLAAKLTSSNAKQVVDDLTSRNQFEIIVGQIGRGSDAWVSLAPHLAPGTDAASAEG